MVVILIRRFVRPDREAAFLDIFTRQRPDGNPDFVSETLTRLVDPDGLPEDAKGLFAPASAGLTYLNIARWRSWDAFARHFAVQLAAPGGFDPTIETARREIAVMEIVT